MASSTALLVLAVSLWFSIIAYTRTRDLLHPSILVTSFFVLPAASTALHWSSLQAVAWEAKTEILVVSAVICFVGIPALLAPKIDRQASHPPRDWEPPALMVARVAVIVFLCLFMLENYVATGYLIPARGLTSDTDVHTLSMPGLLWVTRNAATFSTLAMIVWIQKRKPVDLLLTIACVFIQLTRLGRIDVWMASVAVAVTAYHRFPQGKTRQAILRVGFISAVVAVLGLAALTNYRMTIGYTYNLTYSEVIGYSGPRDPAGLLPFLYGYFSLSFENLNALVRDLRMAPTWPLFTFRPIWGLLQFHNLFKYELSVMSLYEPVGGAANVPTGLAEFYVDVGLLAFVPMALYGFLWSKLYKWKDRSLAGTAIYAVFTAAGSLLGFQALILSAPVYFGFIVIYVVSRFGYKPAVRIQAQDGFQSS